MVIFVDDMSADGTGDAVKRYSRQQMDDGATLSIVLYERDAAEGTGLSSAVVKGFSLAKRNVICAMDADLSHSPTELRRNINYFYGNSLDLLIGSRYLKNSLIIHWPVSRKILSKLSNILARVLLGVPVKDYTNGYRFYSLKAAKKIIFKCNKPGGGFIILSEIILVLWKSGFKISEIKTIFRNRTRGESSVNLSLVAQSLIGLLKLYLIKKSSKI